MSERLPELRGDARLRHGVAMVGAIEARMRQRSVDAVAQIPGRENAEQLAADVYRKPPALQLSPGERAALADAERACEVER